jgi:cell division septum initiation protein DivIVA
LGKSRRGNKEFTREQRLIKENRQLKQQVSQLRKQLARLDLDRYETVREMIEERRQEDRVESAQDLLDSLKQKWACKEPGCQGYLEITVYSKLGQPWYFRKCTECPNRTVAKKYTPEVKGIVKSSEPKES